MRGGEGEGKEKGRGGEGRGGEGRGGKESAEHKRSRRHTRK